MNQVILFKDITTEDALLAIESYSLKYNADIVADMNYDDDRRVIKKEASEIADMRKAVERARIDKKKVYGKQVDKEAEIIDGRLAKANEPFDVLINNYNAERKLILEAENARKKAIEDQAAIDSDYEIAVLLMDKYFADKAKAETDRLAHEESLRLEGAQQAQQALVDAEARRLADIATEKQRGIDERKQQEFDAEQLRIKATSDADHVASVHRNIKAVFMAAGFNVQSSENAVKLLVAGKLPHVKLTY
jgi:hypothetical protein